jgi:hypothetical protein
VLESVLVVLHGAEGVLVVLHGAKGVLVVLHGAEGIRGVPYRRWGSYDLRYLACCLLCAY